MASVTDSPKTASMQAAARSGRVVASVLIPVLNEERYLPATVPAMQAQRFDGEIEFLFMDGRSADRTRALIEEMAAKDPRVRLLDNVARQTASGLNVGLRAARGEYVVRMDAHTYYPPDYIATGVERLNRGDVDWVCGPQIAIGEGKWSRRVSLALNSRLGTGASRRFGEGDEVTDAPQAAESELDTGVFTGIWKRSTVEALGGWDEGWPVNQDSELAARVLDAGGRIVSLPELGASYVPRDSLRTLARQYRRYGYYRAKTARRHPSSMRRSHLFAPTLVAALTMSLLPLRPLARAGRAASLVYLVILLLASVRVGKSSPRQDAMALPVVFAAMHCAWGAGFLAGCARYGPPLAAVVRLLSRDPKARSSASRSRSDPVVSSRVRP